MVEIGEKLKSREWEMDLIKTYYLHMKYSKLKMYMCVFDLDQQVILWWDRVLSGRARKREDKEDIELEAGDLA